MADEKSYLSYTGLVKLVEQIKSLVSTAAKDASTKAYDSAKSYSDSSLKAHIEAKDASNNSIHVSLADRTKWDAAATTAAGTVSKEEYNEKVAALEAEDASITTALGKTDASLKLTDGSLDKHIKDTTVHITAAERTSWDNVVTDFGKHDSSADIHVTKAEKDSWTTWVNASTSYYTKNETYKKTEVDEKISALGAVFNFKGTVATKEDLPKADNKKGDVYHVTTNSAEFVWVLDASTGESGWEELGSTVDLSAYATKADVSTAIENVDSSITAIKGNIDTLKSDVSTLKTTVKDLNDASTSYAKAADLTELTTRVTTAETDIDTLEGKVSTLETAAAGYATKTYVDGKFTDAEQKFAGTAANATLAADASKLGNVDASEYALKSELAEQMVEAIHDASITALFNA